MTDKKRGFFSRFFGLLGAIGKFVRTALNILFLVILLAVIASLFAGSVKPLPNSAFLRLAPTGLLVEQLSYSDSLSQLLGGGSQYPAETLLSDLVEAIDAATDDPRITGVALQLDLFVGGGITKLSQVGAALNRFKASGKPIIATGSNFSQEQYYLASFADEIHVNPMGMVLVTGYGMYQTYYKQAIDKLGLNFHVFRAGDYKDAIEPFTRDSMSEASRRQTRLWLDELWLAYTGQVESNRELAANAINNYISNMDVSLAEADGSFATLAKTHALIDRISTQPQMLERLQALAGRPANDENDYLHVDFSEYLFHQRLKLPDTDGAAKIGLIVAKGAIYDGDHPEGSIGSVTLSKLIQRARRDGNIKALVIRVDSPGGSAFASDVIRREIDLTSRAGKPVVISMGSVAASGGYWIAAGADAIWAEPTTLTGSIGVFGLIPTFENSLGSLGIHSDGVGTTPLADIYRLDRPMSAQAQRIIQLNVEHIYEQFIALVATGRDLPKTEVHRIAQGRVWSGRQAQQLGLVDELGGQRDAITAAAELANVAHYKVQKIERQLNFRERMMKQLAQGAEQIGLLSGATATPPIHQALAKQLMLIVEQAGLLNPRRDPGNMYLECIECRLF